MAESSKHRIRETNRALVSGALIRAIFRMCLSGIFVVAGINHLVVTDKIVQKLEAAPLSWLATGLAPPKFLIVGAGVALLAGGLALLVGFYTRRAAVGLIMLLIPITITVQVGRFSTIGPLFKNIAIFGGLLYFAVHGSQTLVVRESD